LATFAGCPESTEIQYGEILAEEGLDDPLPFAFAGNELLILDMPNSGRQNREGLSRVLAYNLAEGGFRVVANGGLTDPQRVGLGDNIVLVLDADGLKSVPLAGGNPTTLVSGRFFKGERPLHTGHLDIQGTVTVFCDENAGQLLRVDGLGGTPPLNTTVLADGCLGGALFNGGDVYFGGPKLPNGEVELRRGYSDRNDPDAMVATARGVAPYGVTNIIRSGTMAWFLLGQDFMGQPLDKPEAGAFILGNRPGPIPWFAAGQGDTLFLGAGHDGADVIEKLGPLHNEIIRLQPELDDQTPYNVVRGTRMLSLVVRTEEERDVIYYGTGARDDVAAGDPAYENGMLMKLPFPDNLYDPLVEKEGE
jgi:hypothetical protein